MVDQAVKNGCCHGAVLKNVSPFGKGNVSRQDGGMHLVPQPAQLEEETGLLFGNRQISDFIDDKKPLGPLPLQNPFECSFFIR